MKSESKNKRILVYGMSDNPGGIETYLLSIAERLINYGINFDYVTDFKSIAHEKRIKAMGSKIFFIPAKSSGLLKQWKELYNILKTHPEYHTLYVNALDAGAVLTCIVPFFLKKNIVFHSHNGSTDKIKLHKICRPLLRIVCTQYIACSKQAGKYMFGKNKNNIFIMPNAIDFSPFVFDEKTREKKRKELQLGHVKVICHVGRLSLQKNPFRLIDIFDELVRKEPNAVLLSVGIGELDQEVRAYAAMKASKKKIRFLGRRNDIAEILMASDVFLMPSFYEGLPIAVLEAEASGIACVLSDCIPKEVNINETAQFVSLDEPNGEWVNALLSGLRMPRKRDTTAIDQSMFNARNISQYDEKLAKILRS